MGGLLHLFDFNQDCMAWKVLTHERHVSGLEAPRNSLELQAESSQSYCSTGDIPYSYKVEEDWPGKKCYQSEVPMKKIINEEVSKRTKTRQNAPSIVARLMGMDMFPADTNCSVQPTERKNENTGNNFIKKERVGNGSVNHIPSISNSSGQMELDSFYCNDDRSADRWSHDQHFGKPWPREHPQEEELQKFKKEFQEFQASRFGKCSKAVEFANIPRQLLAQENLNKEKMELYVSSRRTSSVKKPVKPKGPTVKKRSHEIGGLQSHGDKPELFPTEQKESFPLRRIPMSAEFEQFHSHPTNSDQKFSKSSALTDIVILKPGPDKILKHESFTNSSGTSEGRRSIEEFLEEVKERLKCELQGKVVKKGTVARGSGIETPFSEKSSNPKTIALHIAKQVRESVTRDLGMNLLRSESTRSHGSEIQFNVLGSPEFISKDTRKFLSERLKNTLRRESHMDTDVVVNGSFRSSELDNKGERLKHSRDTLKSKNEVGYWGIVRDGHEMHTGSFRHGTDYEGMLYRELSPRNLIRSLSAPVSGTSFGKLLLEDRHSLTGAQIRRKHEVIENVSGDAKNRKERFKFKEKVSHFRYSFNLGGRLFGRKIESSAEPCHIRLDPKKDIWSGPTVITNFSEGHENSTEVPPSPASVCSSVHEEFWRVAESVSPVSTPDVTTGDNSTMPQVFRDISSNLNELRRQLNQLESDLPEETTTLHEPVESEIELEDRAEAYIRDLLVASGLYDGSADKSLSRWDPLAKLISKPVFERVEQSYEKLAKEKESCTRYHNEKVEHKVLLDLLNEALSTVLGPPEITSRFRRKILSRSMLQTLRGKKLLDCVWDIIHVNLYPQQDTSNLSLDDIMVKDLGSTPWSGLMDDEVNSLGRDMECLIIRDLIGEILNDLQL